MYLYCIVETGTLERGPCKVGVALSPQKRLANLQCGNWRRLEIAWTIPFEDRGGALELEQYVLMRLRPNSYGGDDRERLCSEWVGATPAKAFEMAKFLLDAINGEVAA